MSRVRAVVFDLDGTLVDSLRDIAEAVDGCLAEFGLPTHGEAAYRTLVGDGIGTLVRRAAPEGADLAQLERAVRRRYAAHFLDHTVPYADVLPLLDALQERGVPLAVLSNKPHEMTVAVVDALFAPGTFVVVRGDRPPAPRKPDPAAAREVLAALGTAPDETLMVGDTPVDLATARAASMPSAAVTWGFRSKEELAAHAPDHVLDAPLDLLACL